MGYEGCARCKKDITNEGQYDVCLKCYLELEAKAKKADEYESRLGKFTLQDGTYVTEIEAKAAMAEKLEQKHGIRGQSSVQIRLDYYDRLEAKVKMLEKAVDAYRNGGWPRRIMEMLACDLEALGIIAQPVSLEERPEDLPPLAADEIDF